jgi:hypothetical protein
VSGQCGRKQRYPSLRQARKAAGRRLRADGERLRIYRCEGGWYLSSQLADVWRRVR